jgi:hypothetical protein
MVSATDQDGGTGSASVTYNVIGTGSASAVITGAKIDRRHDKATFRFKATGGAVGFQCKLIKRGKKSPRFASCKSPRTYRHLKHGKYTFEVRASSPLGAGPVTKRRFSI